MEGTQIDSLISRNDNVAKEISLHQTLWKSDHQKLAVPGDRSLKIQSYLYLGTVYLMLCQKDKQSF